MSDIKFDYPKDEPSMICTRSFDAPVALVWKVFTTPEHVARWWGPKSIAPVKKIDKLELRKGGKWRFICERPDGSEQIVFYGTYVDVVPEKKLANSFGVEGQFEGDEAFPEIHTFEERDGRTYYKSYTLLPNFEAREARRRHRHGEGWPRVPWNSSASCSRRQAASRRPHKCRCNSLRAPF